MHLKSNNRDIASLMLVIALTLFLLFGLHEINFAEKSNKITAGLSLAVGGNTTLVENATHDFVYEEPNASEAVEQIIEEINLTLPEEIPDNVTEPEIIPDNLTLPEENIIVPDNVSHDFVYNETNETEFSIPVVNETIVENVSLSKKIVKKVPEIDLNNVVDKYCEKISMFLTKCIVQTEQELCHLEGREIVCNGVMQATSYSDKLTLEQKNIFNAKGIPVNKNGKETEYFTPQLGTRFKVDWNSEKYIHIGFTSDVFVVQDFYYGTCDYTDNCTIDVGVEIKPSLSGNFTPKENNLIGSWNFVSDAIDTSNQQNNGTVYGATHTYERYSFDGDDDCIYVENTSTLNISEGTILFWFKPAKLGQTWPGIVSKCNGDFMANYNILIKLNDDDLKIQLGDGTNLQTFDTTSNFITTDWRHIAVTFNSSNITVYSNGEYLEETALTVIPAGLTIPLHIGCNFVGANQHFNGSIENVAIWNLSLKQREIELIYNETRFNTSGNTVTYSGTFTGGVFDSIEDATKWENLVWDSTEPTGTDISLRYRVGNYSRIDETDGDLIAYWKLNRSDGTNAFADSTNTTPDERQVLHMKFKNATDFYDFSGRGNTATNDGSAYTNIGYTKGGRYFDGVDDYLIKAAGFTQIPAAGEVTVTVWGKDLAVGAGGGTHGVITGIYGAAGANAEIVRFRLTSDVAFSLFNDYGCGKGLTTAGFEGWHFFAAKVSSDALDDKCCVSFDGGAWACDNDVDDFVASTQYIIGDYGTGSTYPLDGTLDNFRVYNTSLNDSQLKELYAKEAGTYDEVGSNQGFANGTGRAGGVFESDGALSFDGKDDYISLGHDASLDFGVDEDFTASFWMKTSDVKSRPLTKGAIGGAPVAWGLLFAGTGDLFGKIRNGSYNFQPFQPAGINVSDNKWHLITFVVDRDVNLILYVDGVAGTAIAAAGSNVDLTNNFDLVLGADDNGTSMYFNGTIDSLAIYNKALTTNEISDLYTSWGGWSAYDGSSPMSLSGRGKLLQYQAKLETPDNSLTPVLNEVNITNEPAKGIDTCRELNISGQTYAMNASIDNAAATCMIIDNHSVTLDCDGYYIDGQDSGNGIELMNNMENLTIINCDVRQFFRNLESDYNVNVTIENFTSFDAAYHGMDIDYPTNFTLRNIFVNYSTYRGIHFSAHYLDSVTNIYNLTSINAQNSGSTYAGFYYYQGAVGSLLNITGFNISDNGNYGFYARQYATTIDLNDGHIDNNGNSGFYSATTAEPIFYLDNITFFNNYGNGIYLGYSTGGVIKNCNISFNEQYGLYFYYSTVGYNITGNDIKYNKERDVFVSQASSTGNDFWNNNFEVNLMVEDEGSNNWNLTTGNTWDNYDSDDEDCVGAGGFCPNPYLIAGSSGMYDKKAIYTGVQGTLQQFDCHNCVDCTEYITNWTAKFGDNLSLTADVNNYGANCIDFLGHNGILFDGGGNTIDGTNTGSVFYIYPNPSSPIVGSDWITIRNVHVQEFQRGIYSYYSQNLTVFNFSGQDNTVQGVYLNYLNIGNFTNIGLDNNDADGLDIASQITNSELLIHNISASGNGDVGLLIRASAAGSMLNITSFNFSRNTDDGIELALSSATHGSLYLKDGHCDNNVDDGFVTGASQDIPVTYVDNVSFVNNTGKGVYFQGDGSGGEFKNCTIMFNKEHGLHLYYDIDNYNFTNNTIKYNYDRDVYIQANSQLFDNRFWKNHFEVNALVVDLDGDNHWNLTISGNQWDNYDSDDEDCTSVAGFCANDYQIGGSTGSYDKKAIYTGIQGTLNDYNCSTCGDCTERIHNWSIQFGDNLTLRANINNFGATCVDFRGHNGILFNGSNHLIDGTGAGNAFSVCSPTSSCTTGYVGSDFITITNINTQQFDYGMRTYYNFNLTLINYTSFDEDVNGLFLYYHDTGYLENIFINFSGDRGIRFDNHQTDSLTQFYNLTITETVAGATEGFYYYLPYAGSVLNITLFNISYNGDIGFYQQAGGINRNIYLTDGYIENNTDDGVYWYTGTNSDFFLDNVSILGNGDYGLYVYGTTGGEIKNSRIANNSDYGLYYVNTVDSYNVSNTKIKNNTNLDVYIAHASCDDNKFWNNTFENNNTNISDIGTGTEWNISTGGNRWLNFDTDAEGCHDVNLDGFCDDANVTIPGAGGGKDELPLYVGGTAVSCGSNITTDTTLTANLTCNGTALNLVADNIYLDCDGFIIRGDGAGEIGIKINSSDINVTNCFIYNFTTGIYADPGVGLIIENNTFVNSTNCTILEDYNSSVIRNNSYHNCTDNAILLINESRHNRIYNNTINLSWVGVNIRNGTNNTVWNNSFTNSLHLHANAITGNYFNSSVGNYWDDILSLAIYDANRDGLGDSGPEYPYNSSNNANTSGTIQDYRPFTTKTVPAPNVTLIYPVNDTILNGRNVDFNCYGETFSALVNITNMTLYIWDSGNSLIYQHTQEVGSVSTNSQNWTYILPSADSYRWTCEVNNTDVNNSFALKNYTFNVTFRTAVDNVTTDVDTELKPFDSLENLPQQNNLVGRWDFVEDATDTSIFGNNGTVHGAEIMEQFMEQHILLRGMSLMGKMMKLIVV